jgi:hypothetical protein
VDRAGRLSGALARRVAAAADAYERTECRTPEGSGLERRECRTPEGSGLERPECRTPEGSGLERPECRTPAVVVVSGGRRWSGVVEADAMARELALLGVPEQVIARERCSLSTRDNARFAAAVLARRGLNEATLITCAWHLPRAIALFEQQGVRVVGLAAAPSAASWTRRLWRWGRERALTALAAKVILAGMTLAPPLLAPACTCTGGSGDRPPPAEAQRDFGDTTSPVPDAAPYLALARSILEHKGRSAAPSLPPSPGRRVLLAAYPAVQAPSDSVVATALGSSLADAVSAAAESLATKVKDVSSVRLELDLPTALSGATIEADEELPLASIGLQGVLITSDDGKTGAVLPGEIVERGLFHESKPAGLSHGKLAALLAKRANVAESALGAMRAYRFRADAHVENAARDGALRVVRGMIEPPAQVTAEALVDAVRSGADYLVRVLNGEGRYVYMYRAVEDRDDSSYGWLRHAGTTYALLEAYEEFGTPLYAQKARLALAYLKAHLKDDTASQGKYVVDTTDEEQQKTGGAGLALLAFAKHAATTGDRSELETMRALARFVLKAQYEDGHFRCNADLEHESGKKLKREPVYYPGEAVLALMRLYAIDPQPAYLDGARRGADWVVHVRDAYVSEDNQEHDHWMSYAMNELYRVTRDDAYLEHAYKIARAIQKKQQSAADAPAPDFAGTFYEGQTTPASTRVEAFDADIALARFAGKPEGWLLEPATAAARSMLGQQYRPDNDYWLANPAKAAGGVRESLFVHDVRIDYVQHAMSAWLHLARTLRDPEYGKRGVPSQDPVRTSG